MDNLQPAMAAALATFAPAPVASRVPAATYCSACGCYVGQGTAGVSHCRDHADRGSVQVELNAEQQMAAYRALLDRFDWQYDASEDHGKWAQGFNTLSRLRRMQQEIDPLGEVWMSYPGARGDRAPRPYVRLIS